MHLVAELSSNKSSRIRFESSSANGLLLFKECSGRTIVAYGSRLLVQPVPAQQQDVYRLRYKGIAYCLDIMTHSLAGEYINFGVFQLYGDTCFTDALGVVLRLALSIPLQEITAYQKLAKAFFSLIDVLCAAQAHLVASFDPAIFVKLFQAVDEGLRSTDPAINALCCTTLDNVMSWYLAARRKPAGSQGLEQSQAFEQKLGLQPDIVSHFFLHLFRIILATDCQYLYSVARPLHVLLIAAPQAYEGVRASIVAAQPVLAQQEKLAETFQRLTADVSGKTDPKSRERFTQNLVVFAHSAKTFISPFLTW
jgi:exportin-7